MTLYGYNGTTVQKLLDTELPCKESVISTTGDQSPSKSSKPYFREKSSAIAEGGTECSRSSDGATLNTCWATWSRRSSRRNQRNGVEASRGDCNLGQERQRVSQAHVRSDVPEKAVRAPPRLVPCHWAVASCGSTLAARRIKTMDDDMVLTTVALKLKMKNKKKSGTP